MKWQIYTRIDIDTAGSERCETYRDNNVTQNSCLWNIVKVCDLEGREINEKHEQRREKTWRGPHYWQGGIFTS
jgi:hypothetical protein